MKNKVFLFLFIAICTITVNSYAQSATDSLPSVSNPEKRAEFKGGLNGWTKFLETNLDHDLLDKNKVPMGSYTVIGNFLIDSLGKVSDIRIMKDPGYGAAAEFIRVLKKSSGKWVPAYDKGVAVPYRNIQSLTLRQNF